MLDSSRCSSASYSATSPVVTVMSGPSAPAAIGWSLSTTTAVVILVSEATGTGISGPDWALNPRDGTTTAPWPFAGHGSIGGAPGTTVAAVTMAWGTVGASGALMRCAATADVPPHQHHGQPDHEPRPDAVAARCMAVTAGTADSPAYRAAVPAGPGGAFPVIAVAITGAVFPAPALPSATA